MPHKPVRGLSGSNPLLGAILLAGGIMAGVVALGAGLGFALGLFKGSGGGDTAHVELDDDDRDAGNAVPELRPKKESKPRNSRPSTPQQPTRSEPKPKPVPVKPLPALTARPVAAGAELELLAHVEKQRKEGRETDTDRYGGGAAPFREVPQPGALLIGLDVIFDGEPDFAGVRSVRPLFWGRQGSVLGSWHGGDSGQAVRIEAKPGYVVGELRVAESFGVTGLQAMFVRVRDGLLDFDDKYFSERIGGGNVQDREPLGGDGALVVGVFGRAAGDTHKSCGLGLVTVPKRPKPAPPLTPRPNPTKGELALLEYVEAAVRDGKTSDSRMFGDSDDEYRDVPSTGALLVGLDFILSKPDDGGIISSVRPLYWSRAGVAEGRWHGRDDQDVVRIEAKPGYVVAGLVARSGLGLDNAQLIFMRVNDDGLLDPRDRYVSRAIGGSGGGTNEPAADDGSPVVGVFGKSSARKHNHTSGLGLVTIPKKPAPPLAPADEKEFFAALEKAVADQQTRDLEMLGRSDQDYRDVPPKGALLVGLEVALGKFIDSDTIRSVRPIYRYADGVKDGVWHGGTVGRRVRSAAKPGYAVGALKVHSGLGVTGLQIVYMRITKYGLDPADSYESQLIGGDSGGLNEPMAGDGSFVVGIHGMAPTSPSRSYCGLGLVTIPTK